MTRFKNKKVLNIKEMQNMLMRGHSKFILGHEGYIITKKSNVYELATGKKIDFVFITGSKQKHVRLWNKERTKYYTIRIRDIKRVHFGSISNDRTFKQLKEIPYLYHTSLLQIDIRNYNIVPLEDLITEKIDNEIVKVKHNEKEYSNYYLDGVKGKTYRKTGFMRYKKIGKVRNDGYVNLGFEQGNKGQAVEHRVMGFTFKIDGYLKDGLKNAQGDKEPRTDIDHINNIRDDNRSDNLQFVTKYENNILKIKRIEMAILFEQGKDLKEIPQYWNDLRVY